MLQDQYRDLYKGINKNWQDSVTLYRGVVSAAIFPGATVLEAGCGFSTMFAAEYKRAGKVIGVDIDAEFLARNELVDQKIVSDLASLPELQDNSVDVIMSSWVLEHLENPAAVFAEIRRILKPGGKFIFLTPNLLNYVVFLNQILPDFIRMFVVNRMSENLITHPMRVWYRANTVYRLSKLTKNNNLELSQLTLNGDPTYVAISKPFFYLGVVIESLLSLPLLRKMRVHIIATVTKAA